MVMRNVSEVVIHTAQGRSQRAVCITTEWFPHNNELTMVNSLGMYIVLCVALLLQLFA